MWRVLGNFSCYLDFNVKVKGQIMHFLVNVSPPKLLDVPNSIFVAEYVI